MLVVFFGAALAWGALGFEALGQHFGWFTALDLEAYGAVRMSWEALRAGLDQVRWIHPVFCGPEILSVLSTPEVLVPFLTVSIPMGLLNVLGSLQNIESAEAAGDRYPTAPSLAVNGLGTIAASLFGSCFPTTIYIGHPAWKSMGAKSGYSILNGFFFSALFLFGCGTILSQLIPIEAGAAIVMYIGIIITAQAFQATPRAHAPAVAIAMFPALAALLAIKFPLLMAGHGLNHHTGRTADQPRTKREGARTARHSRPVRRELGLAGVRPHSHRNRRGVYRAAISHGGGLVCNRNRLVADRAAARLPGRGQYHP